MRLKQVLYEGQLTLDNGMTRFMVTYIMFSEKKPLRVHIELSDKCNAMCPQRGRNRIVGDKINPKNNDMQDINYVWPVASKT